MEYDLFEKCPMNTTKFSILMQFLTIIACSCSN